MAAASGCWAKVEVWRRLPGNGVDMSREELWKEEAVVVEVVEEMEEEE